MSFVSDGMALDALQLVQVDAENFKREITDADASRVSPRTNSPPTPPEEHK